MKWQYKLGRERASFTAKDIQIVMSTKHVTRCPIKQRALNFDSLYEADHGS